MPAKQHKNAASHAAKVREVLDAAAAGVAKASEPLKKSPTAEDIDEVAKDDNILAAGVARMTELCEGDDTENLYHVALVICQHVLPSVGVGQIKTSGLPQFLVAAINRLGAAEENAVALTPLLEMAEVCFDNPKVRNEMFPAIIQTLTLLGISEGMLKENRRSALLLIQNASHGSDQNRELVDLASLAKYAMHANDFPSQTYIVATAGKLCLKKKFAAKSMAVLKEAWGEELAARMKEMFEASPQSAEPFVVELNRALPESQVQTMSCSEWNIGGTVFKPSEKVPLLLHSAPAYISFNLPCNEDGEDTVYDPIDIPYDAVAKLNSKGKTVDLEFKTGKLPNELLRHADGRATLLLSAKCPEKGTGVPWANAVGKRVSSVRKSTKRQSESKRKLQDSGESPAPKALKTSEDARPSRAVSASQQQAKALRLSIDPMEKREPRETESSPYAHGAAALAEQGDLDGDNDMENVFEELRSHFQKTTTRRQQKGREGLEKTLHGVQRLVDAYKESSNKYELRLTETMNDLRMETEKAHSDFTNICQSEKQMTKDIEGLHSEFQKTALAHSEMLEAFKDEVDETLPKIRAQETERLGKLKDMVDDEFTKLEDQVSKIQSQKTMMTRMMKFIMTNFD
eukprot:TRINITY_DN4634_c0_g1_i1.p1 TRINITY_DN4634_c0_g1~~TRINITY_DN4634_c0_g1_i1.p1  ORF type:complete len:649 (+),score=277.38 TRINITY_DN4634_c0_g1_i1:62-1948(+)